jgi:hypothetical protein
MKKTIVLVLLFALAASLGASDFPKVEGWKAVSEVQTFGPENLWEYINGAAELFLGYDFQFLRSCDISRGDLVVTVDIYDMGTRLNAFGVYRAERPRQNPVQALGVEGVVSPPYQCLLLKDVYYVKVNAYEGEIDETNGKALLAVLDKALPGADTYPQELELLPEEGKILESEGFAKRGYLGLGELTDCVYATYQDESDAEYQYFAIVPGPDDSVESIWQRLGAKWKGGKHKGHPVLFREIPYKGLVGVVLTDKGIFGVTDSKKESEMMRRLGIFVP